MNPAEHPDANQRAAHAAQSVTGLFGGRLLFLPGTHLAATSWPRPRGLVARLRGNLLEPWHYWWQAHYLDALVDAGQREMAQPTAEGADAARLAARLLTGIRLRNLNTLVNNYYDDMAWLALATLRLDQLADRRRYRKVGHKLTGQFEAACSDDLGGGVFWSKERDFKNTPATAPVALYFARTGQAAKAQGLVDWLDATLFDAEANLYLDGARAGADGTVLVERNIYTYNQGPILGALLELGGEANLVRACTLIEAVECALTVPAQPSPVSMSTAVQAAPQPATILRCDGTGDAGLFTGILCRYLAIAAKDSRLPAPTRAIAARLVTDTADAFWAGRRTLTSSDTSDTLGGRQTDAKHQGLSIFSQHATQPAAETYPPGTAVELSTQLQAWLVLEAAAGLPAPSPNDGGIPATRFGT
ncbi:Glycosyl hydrolase family 76 [Arthrobacter ulcerisalmonis]|uniref:Glycosyl hydrolase family 76 n=1 Tax=Arthrobacter ulcerisalmonis TaxID=2483813 RepID=A0A3P5WKN2_9MICC|nr:glycoside hydrolase family 76 protein [Arthrobacter ulcerisalmonis]VDC22238.1 Glycosyl hydrolase family 76 [Arthrobacter ulcerisalmonis]